MSGRGVQGKEWEESTRKEGAGGGKIGVKKWNREKLVPDIL